MGTTTCGFCMTGHHKDCRKEIKYYDKTWECRCKLCNPQEKENNGTQKSNNPS